MRAYPLFLCINYAYNYLIAFHQGLYNALLRANYLQNDVVAAARRADDIYEKLLALNQEGDLDVEPNRATYRTIVLIWSKIKTKEASSKMAYYKSMFQRHNAKYS